jgi:alanyl-tRNA synthetase
VPNTAEIGLFKFVAESSIASGVRRVEALTGFGVQDWIAQQEQRYSELSREFEELQSEKQRLEKELTKFRLETRRGEMKRLVAEAQPLDGAGINIIAREIAVTDSEELKALAEMLQGELRMGTVVVLGAKLAADKVSLISLVTDDLIKEKKIQAGKLIGRIAEVVGGKGGGRPNMAQAGGKHPERLQEALDRLVPILKESLGVA